MSELKNNLPLGLRSQQRLDRDAEILEAAWSLLAEKGYEDWTLADLADRVGISRRTLYHHFASKEAIAAATIARNILRSVAEMETIADTNDAGAKLKAVIHWFVERRTSPKPGPVGTIKAEPGLMSTIKTFPVYQAASTVLLERFTELVRRAQAAGAIRQNFPPGYLASLLIDMVQGIDVTRWQTSHPQIADDIMAIVFHGIAEVAMDES